MGSAAEQQKRWSTIFNPERIDVLPPGAEDVADPVDAAVVATVELELAELECRRYTDPRGVDIRARRLLTTCRGHGMITQRARARLILADADSRGDDGTAAVEIARSILLRARGQNALTVAARSEAVIAWCLFRMGAIGDALAHAVEAVRLLPDDAPAHLRVDHRMILVLLDTHQTPDPRCVDAFAGVLAAAEDLTDPHLLLAVLNNYAWTLWSHGRLTEARTLTTRLEATSATTGIPLNSTMLDTVAAVLMDTGDLDRAETVARSMIDPDMVDVEVRAAPEALLTLARIRTRQGHNTDALEVLQQAEALAAQRNLPEITAMVTHDKAQLLAAAGDYRGAYDALNTSHTTWVRVRDREADARASSLHALFETEQARRRSALYEELAERDALTGLWNRRHIDRVLPAQLIHAQLTTTALSVAILDLDHFKTVNDRRGHLTGDAILTRLGELLVDLIADPGATARIGGEEFVLIMPGADHAAAYAICESTRLIIRDEPWNLLTDGIPLTASIGHATAHATTTVSSLLNTADEALYAAKHRGRNQVQPQPGADRRQHRRST